mmetsp:Transcript_2907/g.7247  ORF Transcript_2907/g.7247 Transcript_2907/m.7247 type:complete len:642 (+) Transcript_2907:63-1988(+)
MPHELPRARSPPPPPPDELPPPPPPDDGARQSEGAPKVSKGVFAQRFEAAASATTSAAEAEALKPKVSKGKFVQQFESAAVAGEQTRAPRQDLASMGGSRAAFDKARMFEQGGAEPQSPVERQKPTRGAYAKAFEAAAAAGEASPQSRAPLEGVSPSGGAMAAMKASLAAQFSPSMLAPGGSSGESTPSRGGGGLAELRATLDSSFNPSMMMPGGLTRGPSGMLSRGTSGISESGSLTAPPGILPHPHRTRTTSALSVSSGVSSAGRETPSTSIASDAVPALETAALGRAGRARKPRKPTKHTSAVAQAAAYEPVAAASDDEGDATPPTRSAASSTAAASAAPPLSLAPRAPPAVARPPLASPQEPITHKGAIDVSGAAITQQPGWNLYMAHLMGTRLVLSMITPPHQFVAVIELSTYRVVFLPNMPDAKGCLQLDPLHEGHRAWIHVPLKGPYAPPASPALDGWLKAIKKAQDGVDSELGEVIAEVKRSFRSARAANAYKPVAAKTGRTEAELRPSEDTHDLTESEKKALEFRVASASFVVRGSRLTKFVNGKRKAHARYFKVLGTSGMIKWDSGTGKIKRAEPMVPGEMLKAHKLGQDEISRCFLIKLEHRDLLLMAPTIFDKQAWVAGVNATMLGLTE